MHRFHLDRPWWKLGAMLLMLGVASVPWNAAASTCVGSWTTSTVTGYAFSCKDAKTIVSNTTVTAADDNCVAMGYDIVCSPVVTYTTACTYNLALAKYEISGYTTYKCSHV